MFNFKRNQVIITVLVFMIAIAAYLNTQDPNLGKPMNLVDQTEFASATPTASATSTGNYFAENSPSASSEDQEALSEGVVSGSVAVLPEEIDQDSNSAQSFQATITKKDSNAVSTEVGANAVASNAGTETDYFAEEKLEREQSRASQVEQLSQYVANENLDAETKAKAAENLLEIQERIEKENGAEALLRAKGFKEVYVRIDDNGVDVVVSKTELTDADIAQIEEIVNRKTGFSVSKIKITPLNTTVKTEN